MSDPRFLCPVSGDAGTESFFVLPAVPVHCNLLWPTAAGARAAPREQISLRYCPACGHVFNSEFDATRMGYADQYENSLHFSPRFQHYAGGLAEELVQRHALAGKTILEIGCGQGDFLKLLCRGGRNRGIGFDPGFRPAAGEALPESVEIRQSFFPGETAEIAADFVVCRHVLEHIEHPVDFLGALRAALPRRREVRLYFEVPNLRAMVDSVGVWDVIYEHCAYFSAASLGALFSRCGFTVLRIREMFAGQYLGIEAGLPPDGEPQAVSCPSAGEMPPRAVRTFRARAARKLARWRDWAADRARAGSGVVIWGAGSKGVTFLNVLGESGAIDFAVDLNPRKHGKYIAGTGQKIVPPEALRDIRPETILIMNPVYQDEIQNMVRRMELNPAFDTV